MNIEALDLNLLRLFDAIWRRRSVSQAAEELGLSQPAASQGLSRLRHQLGDVLFHRAPGGVQPTRGPISWRRRSSRPCRCSKARWRRPPISSGHANHGVCSACIFPTSAKRAFCPR